MSTQDCPNCHYQMPKKKEVEPEVPHGTYNPPAAKDENAEDCAQCFYQPGAKEEKKTDDCSQCFYQPGAARKEEKKPEKKEESCAQCFYQPKKND